MMSEENPSVCWMIINTVKDSLCRCRTVLINRENLCSEKRSVKSVCNNIETSCCNYKPEGVYLFGRIDNTYNDREGNRSSDRYDYPDNFHQHLIHFTMCRINSVACQTQVKRSIYASKCEHSTSIKIQVLLFVMKELSGAVTYMSHILRCKCF